MSGFEIDPAPAVYWFWHTIPEPVEIRRQLHEMHAAGIKTFLIQARSAMPLDEFLSERYFSAYRTAMQEAKSLGMIAGIYDDYNWDSGQAGGRSVKLNENARERHLFWVVNQIEDSHCELTVSGIHSQMYSSMGEGILNWIYESGRPEWGNWSLFKVLAIRPGFSEIFANDVVDLTSHARVSGEGRDGCRIKVDLPRGSALTGWKIAAWVAGKCVTSRLINYLSADAVGSFIQAGYEPYKKAVGDYFGDPIQFVFFDHPYGGFYGWNEHCGEVGNSLMFDERLPAAFYSQYQYPIEKALLAFIEDVGDATPRLRTDFFDFYGKLGRETFFGSLSSWTKENGLALSGHELLAHVGAWGFTEGFHFLDPRTNFGADYFAIDRFRDQTAVDACNFHPQVSAKIGDSVARANGRRGCRLEQYAVSTDPSVPGGAGQWGLTLDEMRSQAIRHTFFGATQFIFHAYWQTDGKPDDLTLYQNPRFDFAPGINFEPWFQKVPLFAAENKALSEYIQQSEPQPGIAVLFPLLTWWAENYGHKFSEESGRWFRFLLENNYSFDLISQDQLDHASVENGCLKIGKESYQTLIFPAVTTLNSAATLDQIRLLVSSGGHFVASGELPSATRNLGRDPGLRREFERLVLQSPGTRYFEQFPEDMQVKEEFGFLGLNSIEITSTPNQPIWAWQGKRDGNPVILYFNDSPHADRIRIKMKDVSGLPYRLDIPTGKETPWLWYEQLEKDLIIHLDVEARALGGIMIRKEENCPHLLQSDAKVQKIETIKPNRYEFSLSMINDIPAECLLAAASRPEIDQRSAVQSDVQLLSPSVWKVRIDPGKFPRPLELTGWILKLPEAKKAVPVYLSHGWELQGLQDYAGEAIYCCQFEIKDENAGFTPVLILPRVQTTSEVWLDGNKVGESAWPPNRFVIPSSWYTVGEHQLEIKVRNTAANHYYAGTPFQPGGKQPSGLLGSPTICFEKRIKIICD